jgi:tousled-like kinase
LLRTLQMLPEKEARVIAAQIAAGLAYMNGPAIKQRIIHYDLKPANILFDQRGEVKITVRFISL